MKQLLERWSQLEPHLCKRETRPNKDWHEEFEDYKIILSYGEYLVYSDSQVYSEGRFDCWKPNKEVAMAYTQWAVQQAIIEKGWYFEISYNKSNFNATVYSKILPNTHTANTSSEALLSAYLETFNGNS